MPTFDDDPWREIRAVRLATCVHFTGVLNAKCEAGIPYARVQRRAGGRPVFACFANTACRPACPQYRAKTAAELELEDREADRIVQLIEHGLSPCCEAPLDEDAVVRSGEYADHGPRFCSACRKLAFRR